MKRLFLLFILLNIYCSLFSQLTISGKVTDDEAGSIEFAIVTLKQANDSSVVAYATTDENGKYSLMTSKQGMFFISVSYLGYVAQIKHLNLHIEESINDFDFIMIPDAIALQEVVIKGRRTGVLFDNDTIRYNPELFKDGSEVLLGDLLNKLPGIEVDEKGNVKAHGKNVDKILLSGQDFFQGNIQMATKNLSADIAESVEVLNNYSEYSMLSGFQNHEKTVINIGVNKNKLGKVSGNLSIGGGIENKYELRGDLMHIKPTWMTSVIGTSNNSGEKTFSIEDYIMLQGGVNEFTGNQGQQSTVTLSHEEQKLLLPQNNVYERTGELTGVNFSYQPKNSFKLNSYLLYNKNKEFAEESNKYIFLLPEQNQYSTSNNLNTNSNNKLFSGLFKINYRLSPLWNIVYKVIFSNTGMIENTDVINWSGEQQIHAKGYTKANTITANQNLAVMKSINKHLFISEASFLYNNKPFLFDTESDSLLLPLPINSFENNYYSRQDRVLNNKSISTNFSFFYKINNFYFFRTSLGVNLSKQEYNSKIFDMTPKKEAFLLLDENLKNDFSLQLIDYSFNLNLVKNQGFFRFKAGLSTNMYDFTSSGIPTVENRKMVKLNPELEMSLHFSDKHLLSLSGNKSNYLLPAEAFIRGLVFDDYHTYSHNSQVNQLYNTKFNLNLSYRMFNLYYNTMLILTGGYTRNQNSTTINYFSEGLLIEQIPILSIPTNNIYARIYASKGLGVIPWTLKFTGGYNKNSYYNQSENKANAIKAQNIMSQFQVVTNYRKLLNFECSAQIELIDNASSLYPIKAQTIQRYSGKLKLNFNKKLYANIELERAINKSINFNMYNWYFNSLISYKLNDNTDIILTGQNMFNLKNQDWSSISYNGIYLAERNFRQIPGNILLKLNYRF